MRADLLRLQNIGEKSADWLLEAGYETPAQIQAAGAAQVYWHLRQRQAVSLNMLWALQGALVGLHWARLPDEMKSALLEEVAALDSADAGARRMEV